MNQAFRMSAGVSHRPRPRAAGQPARLMAAALCYFLVTLAGGVPLFADESVEDNAARTAPVTDWHLLEPFWASPIVHRESVLFIREPNAAPDARLVLAPTRIRQIALADGSQVFSPEDYTVDARTRRITLTSNSRIPHLKAEDLFPAAGSPRSIRALAPSSTRDLLFSEGHWFHDRQIEITYETSEAWNGYRPKLEQKSLSGTLHKVQRGEPLTIAVSGDSISFGLNASGVTGARPDMPAYPTLVADQLRASFKSKVTLVNRAVSGWRLEDGLRDLPRLLEAKPDLVIIAYGMNHVGSRDPAGFKRLVATMIERIHASDERIEIILVAPMYGNRHWNHTPAEQFPLHRDVLASFVGPRIALCDLTTLWGQLLERKREVDLTGNGINHPNDFGHRVYAQAVLGLLIEFPPRVKADNGRSPLPEDRR